MDKQTITEKIIALETAALEAWHNGNPSPYLDLYSRDFTFLTPPMKDGLMAGIR